MKQTFILLTFAAILTILDPVNRIIAAETPVESEQIAPTRSSNNGAPSTSAQRGAGSRPPSSSSRGQSASPGDSAGVRGLLQTFDLQSGVFNWRGKSFDLGDAGMAQGRFEKYLNAPAATSEEDLEYNAILEGVHRRLLGRGDGSVPELLAQAWRMLYEASEYPMDAGLSETLAERVVSFWRTSHRIQELLWENRRLEEDLERTESDVRVVENRDRQEFIDTMRRSGGAGQPPPSRDYELRPIERRQQETMDAIEENRTIQAATRLNQRLEFQSLILQYFVQRRFQHAIIANLFYRYIFADQSSQLDGAETLRSQIFGDLDITLTTSTLDAIAKEAMADVEESVQTVRFLLEQGEVHSATRRLMEAFYLGEYLAPIKTFPVEEKRRILRYLRDLSALANALEVRNFDRAEMILNQILEYANDFDSGRAETYIQTSRQLSNLAVQRAMGAANRNDPVAVETALSEAVSQWPTNPAINRFTDTLLERTDQVDVAAQDFDRYLRQNDYRAIFNDRFRFAAALTVDEERNASFLDIMQRMETIEAAMSQARELHRINNRFAAWEVLERAYREYPDDQELNRMRGDFAVRAAEFAAVVANAEDAMQDGFYSQALNAYLSARELYPNSYFVQEGLRQVVDTILASKSN